jgi:hypothetical protein
MKIEMLSQEAQDGLRLWGSEVHGDDQLFDANRSAPEFWAWICYQLQASRDRPHWFPRGQSATIQVIQGYLFKEALESLPQDAFLRTNDQERTDRL